MLGNILVGRYQILKHLGGGGFGETYVACDTQLPGNPQCVVKKLKLQTTDPVALQTARRLFDTEAQVLYKLGTHEQIPQLLAFFEEKEEFYLVQEFIEGHDLSQEITPGKTFSQDQVISLLQEILQILDFVHRQKVIHRDVNPYNLLRRKQDGKLFLIDFGAVKEITTQVVSLNGKTKFTVAIGTPGYIPGEQAQGNPKYSSDIYAVGIIGIQALTGLSPEQLEKDTETNEIIWQNQAQVSHELANFIDKMVRYDFRQRYPSATEALQALKDLRNPISQTLTLHTRPFNQNLNQIKKRKKNIFIKILTTGFLVGLVTAGIIYAIYTINSVNSTELYKQANTFYDLQRYQDALLTYEKAVKIRPDYAEAWNGQGKALFKLKEYKAALTAYDKAIQLQPNYLEAWIGRGFVLKNLQRNQEAIASFDKALEFDHKSPQVWNAKGEVFSNLKQYDEAIQAYEEAINLNKENDEAWYNKALALHNLKRYEDAIAAYDKVLEIKPSYAEAWYNRGNALVNLRRYQDAFIAYEKAVQSQPTYTQAGLSRSNILINLQRYPEALESFNQVIKYSPNNFEAWYGRGWSLHQMQRYEEAIESYSQAIELKRNDYLVWYNRGNSLYNLQKYEEAIASYNRAARYKPNHHESWFSKGNALLNLQRYPEAIASYNQAIKLKPDYQQAIQARDHAQSLLPREKQNTFILPKPIR
ncbi:tetratricopeptide repeat protein [Chlorogloeopsis sp. ULAP01]|uniref:serine/threonine-protein kinase n=1 Tax=Chlorogloeopsis sp. ULAP01 TaxID=3056483 RepID=UPI0025AB3670|nr:serine/threonine-protein kinase [Chlorogloeopsis sp. ULAP01]MDM9382384.1 tetratricopeptide repeat protein [Chlorogloeopsis sp. ULAP01]